MTGMGGDQGQLKMMLVRHPADPCIAFLVLSDLVLPSRQGQPLNPEGNSAGPF